MKGFPPQNTCKNLIKKIKVIPWIFGYHGYENKLGFCRCKQSIGDLTDHFMQLFPHKSVAVARKKLCSVWCPHLCDSNLEASGEAKSSVGFRKALDIVMFQGVYSQWCKEKCEQLVTISVQVLSPSGSNITVSLWWWRRNYFCEQAIPWLTGRGLARSS